ncbi:MAG: Fic family protein [Endomicrobium sp.]|nr:Fic family protein [Endomicrobium sp.]
MKKIHPFIDGNGRTGRLIINFELLKNNITPCIISVVDRSKYFEFLKNDDINSFVDYLETLSKEEMKRIERFASNE